MEGSFDHFWIWRGGSEANVLGTIFEYFQDAWELLADKTPQQADLMVAGIGISRFDLPVLFCRSLSEKVAPQQQLFATYFKVKPIDLSDAGIALSSVNPLPYPKTANQLAHSLNLPSVKQSGRRVWDLFDARDYAAIENRTEKEVRDAILIYERLRESNY